MGAPDTAHATDLARHEELARGAAEVEVTLGVPIKIDGALRTSLRVRRPTVGDIRRSSASSDAATTLIAALCDIAPSALDLLDAADFDVLEAVVIGFRGQRVAR